LLGHRPVTADEVRSGRLSFEFFVPTPVDEAIDWPQAEFRLRTIGWTGVTIRRVVIERTSKAEAEVASENPHFLSLLTVGNAGTAEPGTGAIHSKPGSADFVVFGPHLWLLPGHYEATFELSSEGRRRRGVAGRVEVVAEFGNHVLAEDFIEFSQSNRFVSVLAFDVRSEAPLDAEGLLEFRVWSAKAEFSVTAVDVRRVGDAAPVPAPVADVQQAGIDSHKPVDVLKLLRAGVGGRTRAQAIEAVRGPSGIVAYGPPLRLSPGRYELTVELFATRAARGGFISLETVSNAGKRVFRIEPHWHGRRFERVFGRRRGKLRHTVSLEIPTDVPASESGFLEIRVWSPGTIAFRLTALRIRRVDAAYADAEETAPRSP
jgi:hypothetical protein